MRLVLASASPRRAELLRSAGFTFETRAVDVDEGMRAGEAAASYVRRLAAAKSALVSSALHGPAKPEGPAKAGHYVRREGPAKAGHYVRREGPAKAGHYVRREGPADRLRQGYGGPPKLHAKAEAGRQVRKDAMENARDDTREDIVVLGADTAVVVDGEVLGKPRDNTDAAAILRRLSGRRHDVMTGVSVRMGAYEVGRVETTAVYFAALSPDEIAWYVASGEGRDKAGAYAIQGLASRFIPRIEGSYSNVVGLPMGCVYELLKELGMGYASECSSSRKSL